MTPRGVGRRTIPIMPFRHRSSIGTPLASQLRRQGVAVWLTGTTAVPRQRRNRRRWPRRPTRHACVVGPAGALLGAGLLLGGVGARRSVGGGFVARTGADLNARPSSRRALPGGSPVGDRTLPIRGSRGRSTGVGRRDEECPKWSCGRVLRGTLGKQGRRAAEGFGTSPGRSAGSQRGTRATRHRSRRMGCRSGSWLPRRTAGTGTDCPDDLQTLPPSNSRGDYPKLR
jgi:hypothetical protein